MSRNASASASSAMLRASCDRCRGQKLRCIPASDNPTGPCQRCVRAQVAETCVYAPRTRTGRATQRSGGDTTPLASRREGEASGNSLPGMSHFTIELSPQATATWTDHMMTPHGSRTPKDKQPGTDVAHGQGFEGSSLGSKAPLDGSWDFDLASLDSQPTYFAGPSQDASGWLLSAPGTSSSVESSLPDGMGSNSFAGTGPALQYADNNDAGLQDFLFLPPLPASSEMEIDPPAPGNERPGPLVDMSALLAEMSPYETRLRKLTGSDLRDYPIGDALFLAQRFHDILCAYNYSISDQTNGDLSVLSNGLTHPCYRTMIQIYDAVFAFLHRHLSKTIDSTTTYHEHKHSPQISAATDMHTYRGLRLNQLQPMCFCAGWDPVRKAVSMLISSLGGAEAALSLSPDLRVISTARVATSGRRDSRTTRGIFIEDMSYSLKDGRVYCHTREQARRLRKRVKEVEELLDSRPVGGSDDTL